MSAPNLDITSAAVAASNGPFGLVAAAYALEAMADTLEAKQSRDGHRWDDNWWWSGDWWGAADWQGWKRDDWCGAADMQQGRWHNFAPMSTQEGLYESPAAVAAKDAASEGKGADDQYPEEQARRERGEAPA